MIRVFRPSYDNRELEAIAEVLKSGWVGLVRKPPNLNGLLPYIAM